MFVKLVFDPVKSILRLHLCLWVQSGCTVHQPSMWRYYPYYSIVYFTIQYIWIIIFIFGHPVAHPALKKALKSNKLWNLHKFQTNQFSAYKQFSFSCYVGDITSLVMIFNISFWGGSLAGGDIDESGIKMSESKCCTSPPSKIARGSQWSKSSTFTFTYSTSIKFFIQAG